MRIMRRKGMLPMNLQFFAEPGNGAGAGDGNGGGAGGEGGTGGEGTGTGAGGSAGNGGSGATGEGGGGGKLSFDDFLTADKGNQAEFDRRLQKAVDTAVANTEKKWRALTDDKLSEAEKLAKMSKEEKAEYNRQKKEKELADREAAVTRKELMAEAKGTLAEKRLPVGLAEVLNYTDADACKESIATVEKAFQEAVEAGVQERLKGGEAMTKAGSDDADLAKQVENLMMGITG